MNDWKEVFYEFCTAQSVFQEIVYKFNSDHVGKHVWSIKFNALVSFIEIWSHSPIAIAHVAMVANYKSPGTAHL